MYKLHPEAKIPVFAREGDACADLSVIEDTLLLTNVPRVVKTGIALAIPEGYEAQIRSRSSLPLKSKIIIANGIGTIDCHYTDEIGVLMLNLGAEPHRLEKGTRIAQIAIRRIPRVEYNEMTLEEYNIVKTFSRGGGFGSTGDKELQAKPVKPGDRFCGICGKLLSEKDMGTAGGIPVHFECYEKETMIENGKKKEVQKVNFK